MTIDATSNTQQDAARRATQQRQVAQAASTDKGADPARATANAHDTFEDASGRASGPAAPVDPAGTPDAAFLNRLYASSPQPESSARGPRAHSHSHSHGQGHGPGHTHGPRGRGAQRDDPGTPGGGARFRDPRWRAPPRPQVTRGADGQTTVNLGNGNDNVRVRQRRDGSLSIDEYRPARRTDGTDGPPFRSTIIRPEHAGNVRINGNDGDDRIEVDPSVTRGLTLDGGAGNDQLLGGRGNDRLIGGDGNDHLDGGDGDDTLDGGAGDDQLYGGRGNDRLSGGDGSDWLHGGDGDDELDGGAGNDQLFGGRGNDRLRGGDGDDALAGGEGDDTVDGGAGRDRIFVEGNDRIENDDGDERVQMAPRPDGLGRSISMRGSQRFRDRMEADMDALASIPEGRQLIDALDRTGRRTTIVETFNNNPSITYDDQGDRRRNGQPGRGSDSRIFMFDGATVLGGGGLTPSAVTLAHELAHAVDAATGTTARGMALNPQPGSPHPWHRSELDATGIPYPGQVHLPRPTENDIRRALRMRNRDWY